MVPSSLPVATLLLIGLALASAGVRAEDPADSPPAQTEPAVTAKAEAKEDGAQKELRLPPGFKKVKRGKYTLYCKREAPLGSRLKSETCYDEAQMRDYILVLEQNKGDIDRIRSTCSNYCVCGGDC
jgi:hypothetical protein